MFNTKEKQTDNLLLYKLELMWNQIFINDLIRTVYLDIQGSVEDSLQDNQTAGTVPVDIDQADIGQVADGVLSADSVQEDGLQ